MTTVLFKEESYTIIGCRMRVHSQLGSGFLEAVYEEALTKEFLKQAIPFERQVHLDYELGMLINFRDSSLQ